MTRPIPRATLFAVLALLTIMAATFIWILADVMTVSGGQVTTGLISRAMIFWVACGAVVTFFFAARAASVPSTIKPALLGLLTGATLCLIELGAQVASSPASAFELLAASIGSKLLAGYLGGLWAGKRLERNIADPE